MKPLKPLLALLALSALLAPLYAQSGTITYAVDSACGCDIRFVDGIQTTRSGNLYGFRRYDGTLIAPDIYRFVGEWTNGYCKVWVTDTLADTIPNQEPPLLCGLIDTTGRTIVPPLYDDLEYPSNSRILVVRRNLFGFTDLLGNTLLPPQFPMASSFHENRAVIAQYIDSFFLFYTYIDTLGNTLFPPSFQNAAPFSGGFAPVQQYDRWGIIDTLGNEILPCRFDFVTLPDHSLVFAGEKNYMALYRLPSVSGAKAVQLTPPLYEPVTPVTQNRIGVSRDDKQGFLDLEGDEIIPCKYDEIGLFRHGRTLARIDNHYGIIDTIGLTILPLEYENNTTKGNKYIYYDSLALVEKNGRLGYVDLNGEFVIPLSLEQAYHFSQGLAAVRHNGYWGYINTHGDIYLPLIFQFASPFQWDRAEVLYQGRSLIIDRNGKCVKNCHEIISFR